jgi:hypothetical protein
MREVASRSASHDMLYSSLMGILDVKSSTYEGWISLVRAAIRIWR